MIKKILRILEGDARTTPKQISTMTGASQSEVVKLIKQAEKDQTILKYKTIINWEKVKEEQVVAQKMEISKEIVGVTSKPERIEAALNRELSEAIERVFQGVL